MEEYLDEVCIGTLCCLSMALISNSPFAVVGFLCAIIVICTQSAKNEYMRFAVQGAFILCAFLSNVIFTFLPIAVYAMLHERPWTIRLCWIVPLLYSFIMNGVSTPFTINVVLCFIAAAMAIKDRRVTTEHIMIQRAYDTLRERNLALTADELKTQNEESDVSEIGNLEFFSDLTEREMAVVHLVAEGMDNREISHELFLSEGTVRNHISSILAKKSLSNRTQIAVMYYRS